jgi:predicted dinucleotide-binding enzyme
MRIAVIGAGTVGKAVGRAWAARGHGGDLGRT